MELGEKIQQSRKKKKLSQEELGELIGVTRQTISNWELGESAPDIKEAKELAKIFESSLDELVGNNLENTFIKEVRKTKKITELSLGIVLIHFLLFFSIVIIGFIGIINYFKVDSVGKAVELNCELNSKNYSYKLNLDVKTDKIISFDTNDVEMKNFIYNENESYNEVLKRIKDAILEKGGKCG